MRSRSSKTGLMVIAGLVASLILVATESVWAVITVMPSCSTGKHHLLQSQVVMHRDCIGCCERAIALNDHSLLQTGEESTNHGRSRSCSLDVRFELIDANKCCGISDKVPACGSPSLQKLLIRLNRCSAPREACAGQTSTSLSKHKVALTECRLPLLEKFRVLRFQTQFRHRDIFTETSYVYLSE